MIKVSGAIAVLWLFSAIIGHEMWPAGTTSPIVSSAAEITEPPSSAESGRLRAPHLDARDYAEPRVDVYGNEVEPALAEYWIDRGGVMYERHSPETAVLTLGSPTS